MRSFHVPDVTAKTLREALVTQARPAVLSDDGRVRQPTWRSAKSMPATAPSTTPSRNMSAAASGIPTRSKAISLIFKRGINGTYHHISQQHLKRYLAEFDFRYNERTGAWR